MFTTMGAQVHNTRTSIVHPPVIVSSTLPGPTPPDIIISVLPSPCQVGINLGMDTRLVLTSLGPIPSGAQDLVHPTPVDSSAEQHEDFPLASTSIPGTVQNHHHVSIEIASR